MIKGLNDEEVRNSRFINGSNIICKKKKNSFIRLLIESLGDPIIKILLIALAIKIVFLFKNFDWYETIGILIAIFLASFISSISEYGSNKAFERLQEESLALKTKVYRNNNLIEIYSKDIVVGDLLKINSGDKIVADGIIIKGFLQVDESFMTGETKEVKKSVNNLYNENQVYSGSTVYKGDAFVRVTKVGDQTFIGKLSNKIQDNKDNSPLKEKLKVLAKQISKIGYCGAILASVAYLFMQIVVKNNYNIGLILNTITNYKLISSYIIYTLTLSVTIIIMAVPDDCIKKG